MFFINKKNNKSASTAKRRLMMVISYHKESISDALIQQLKQDLVVIFSKYPQFNINSLEIKFQKISHNKELLYISVPLQ